MNKFLLSQIEQAFGGNTQLPDNLKSLLEKVSNSYDHFQTLLLKNEKELKENHGQIQRVFETTSDAIVKIDFEGNTESWDKKSEALFGWKESEVKGKCLCDVIIPSHLRESHKQAFSELVKSERTSALIEQLETIAVNKSEGEMEVILNICEGNDGRQDRKSVV